MQQATPASWMCRRGGMEQGCDFSPFAGKKIYFREILEPLIVKEGISGQAEARIKKMIHLNNSAADWGHHLRSLYKINAKETNV